MHINMHSTPSTTHPTAFHTLLCTQLTNAKHSWQNGTRCRDGVKLLWCDFHLLWLVFEDSISTCTCFHSEKCEYVSHYQSVLRSTCWQVPVVAEWLSHTVYVTSSYDKCSCSLPAAIEIIRTFLCIVMKTKLPLTKPIGSWSIVICYIIMHIESTPVPDIFRAC